MALENLSLRETDFRIGFIWESIYLLVNNVIVYVYPYVPEYSNVKYYLNNTRINLREDWDMFKFRESKKNLRPIIF